MGFSPDYMCLSHMSTFAPGDYLAYKGKALVMRYPLLKKVHLGVSVVVPWAKNLTVEAWITAEAWVQLPAQHSWLKDPAMLQVQHGLQLQCGFSPWLGNFHMPWTQPKKQIEIENPFQVRKTVFFILKI